MHKQHKPISESDPEIQKHLGLIRFFPTRYQVIKSSRVRPGIHQKKPGRAESILANQRLSSDPPRSNPLSAQRGVPGPI